MVDFNFGNLDFGDYKINQRMHDIFVDTLNVIIEHTQNGKGKLLSVDFNPEKTTGTIKAVFNNFKFKLYDIQMFYAFREYGGIIKFNAIDDRCFEIELELWALLIPKVNKNKNLTEEEERNNNIKNALEQCGYKFTDDGYYYYENKEENDEDIDDADEDYGEDFDEGGE